MPKKKKKRKLKKRIKKKSVKKKRKLRKKKQKLFKRIRLRRRKLKKKNFSKRPSNINFARKLVRVVFNINIRVPKLNLDKNIKFFFDKIDSKIKDFKKIISEEANKRRIEKLRKVEKEQKEQEKRVRLLKENELKEKKDQIKFEEKLLKERSIELKRFIREDQARLRKEQANKKRKFLEKIRLDKKIEGFRKREEIEIQKLQKYVLSIEREDYSEIENRIKDIRNKYQAIRDQKIRERIEQLGIEVAESDTRSDLLQKEHQYHIQREKIEYTLESFYRSMNSCVFQLNRRYLPKKMSLLRVIDRRFETSEIFIKLDEEPDENFLMLVYLKDNNPTSPIILEDKTNPENNFSKEFKSNEIFSFSDNLVDSLTSMIDRNFKSHQQLIN